MDESVDIMETNEGYEDMPNLASDDESDEQSFAEPVIKIITPFEPFHAIKSDGDRIDESVDIMEINESNEDMPNLTSNDESDDESFAEPLIKIVTPPHLDNYIKTEVIDDSDEIIPIKSNRGTKSERQKNSRFTVSSVIKLSKIIRSSRMSTKMFKSRCKNLKDPCQNIKPSGENCDPHISLENLSELSKKMKKILKQTFKVSDDWKEYKELDMGKTGSLT